MNENIRRQFLERLVVIARERVRRAKAGLDNNNAELVRLELHTLAGEAHLLGEDDLAEIARRGEFAAIEWERGVEAQRQVAGESLAGLASHLEIESA